MSFNFTLDDTAQQLIYDGWASQSPTDQNALQFFGGTYHAAQTSNAHVNMTVSGSAFYIYGSKGPRHVRPRFPPCSSALTVCVLAIEQGNFSVQVDGSIQFFSASAPTLQYQQLLFGTTFDPSSSGAHFVSLTAILSDSNPWLDIDFVTTTNGNA